MGFPNSNILHHVPLPKLLDQNPPTTHPPLPCSTARPDSIPFSSVALAAAIRPSLIYGESETRSNSSNASLITDDFVFPRNFHPIYKVHRKGLAADIQEESLCQVLERYNSGFVYIGKMKAALLRDEDWRKRWTELGVLAGRSRMPIQIRFGSFGACRASYCTCPALSSSEIVVIVDLRRSRLVLQYIDYNY